MTFAPSKLQRRPKLAAAAEQALVDAGWRPSTPTEQARTGVAIGAGIGDVASISEAGGLVSSGSLRRVSPYFVPKILINMAACHVSLRHNLRGPTHAAATACASGMLHLLAGRAFRCFPLRGSVLQVHTALETPSA